MNIYTKDFLDFLKGKKINFTISGNYQEKYTISSIFNPVENGFYFFFGDSLPNDIKKSLILCNKTFVQDLTENQNTKIVIHQNPQRVFYEFLQNKYAKKSSGSISETAKIDPKAKLGNNVQIDDFCVIGKCEIGDNSIIGGHTIIYDNARIGFGCTVEPQSIIGATGVAWIWNEEESDKIILPQLGGVKIDEFCFLGANTIVVRGSLNEDTSIGKQTMIAPGARIGHGTQIGNFVHFANSVITGGNTIIEDYCFVGSAAVFRPRVCIHSHTIVGAGAVVVKNTTASGFTLVGIPAKEVLSKEQPSGMPKPKKINH